MHVSGSVSEHASTLPQSDLRVEWFSGTGKGGQNRNKTQNCCRITHIPTGITRSAQTRERKSSYRDAVNSITSAVQESRSSRLQKEVNERVKGQIGSGMRGDKRRTYRERDNIVADHITGRKASMDRFMKGELESLWDI